jgi:serine/threonine protein kinase/tetratricopeptide (TPR) repeat protein
VRHVATPKSALGPLQIGQQFGSRYHILKQLGIGGMGAVYQAWDAELEVAVALKVIRPEVTRDPAAAQDIERRFKQELLLARQVTHKNVVRIHDLGEIEGIKYITMSYIEGSDLATVLRDKKLTVPQVLALAREIAAGLQAAHEAGVVHRDLKPANVMIEHEHAIIMDFGIARSTSRGGSAPRPATVGALKPAVDADMTRIAATVVGEVIGTIEYMAPEQARGEHVDQRADVYAFGLIVYDMLIGRRRSEHAVSAVGELQGRLAHAPPSVRSVIPAVPEPLDALVAKCVEPDPANRFQTTAELVAALDRLDDNGKLKPKKRVVRMPVAVAVAAALLTLSAYIYWVTRPPVVHDPVSVVLADFQNNTGDATLDGTLEPIVKLVLEGSQFVSVYDKAGIRGLLGVRPPEDLNESAAVEIAVRETIGVVLAGAVSQQGGRYEVSLKAVRAVTGEPLVSTTDLAPSKDRVLGVAADLAAEVLDALGDDTSDEARRFAVASWTASSLDVVHQYAVGVEAQVNGKFEEAREAFLKAVTLDPNFGSGYMGLAVMSETTGRQQDAVKYITEAVRHVDRMTERERFRVRASFYTVTKDYASCVKENQDLIARFSQDATARNNLALCASQMRDLPKAMAEMRNVVEILPKRSLYRVNLSLYASYASDFQLAEQEARTALEMKSRWGWLTLAFAQLGQGRVAEAITSYEALAKVDVLGASQAPSGLGDLAVYEGRYSDAVRILQAGAEADLANKNPDRAAAKLVALANAQILRGQRKQAVAAAEQAFNQSPTVRIRFMAGRLYVAAGEIRRAEALASELAKDTLPEPRAYAKILEGQIHLQNGDSGRAINSLTDANALADTWIGRFELGRAYLAANQFLKADSEFDRCLKRRGEAISLFLDEEPTYGLLPEVYYHQGRAREGMGTVGFTESYRTYVGIRGKSAEDPLVNDARKRIGA